MNIIDKTLAATGFIVSDNGNVTTTNFFATFLCEMAVKQNKFVKVTDNHYKLNKDESATNSQGPL